MRTLALPRLPLVAGLSLLVLALFAGLPPAWHRPAALLLCALGVGWLGRRRAWRVARCLWRCLTPWSRAAVLIVVAFLHAIGVAWPAILVVAGIMISAGALNRAREAERVRRERDMILNEITAAVETSSAPPPRVQYLSAQD